MFLHNYLLFCKIFTVRTVDYPMFLYTMYYPKLRYVYCHQCFSLLFIPFTIYCVDFSLDEYRVVSMKLIQTFVFKFVPFLFNDHKFIRGNISKEHNYYSMWWSNAPLKCHSVTTLSQFHAIKRVRKSSHSVQWNPS